MHVRINIIEAMSWCKFRNIDLLFTKSFVVRSKENGPPVSFICPDF